MRDFFFQIALFLAGAVIGITGPLLPAKGQKLTAGILAVSLIQYLRQNQKMANLVQFLIERPLYIVFRWQYLHNI
jgi:hypothetical protein